MIFSDWDSNVFRIHFRGQNMSSVDISGHFSRHPATFPWHSVYSADISRYFSCLPTTFRVLSGDIWLSTDHFFCVTRETNRWQLYVLRRHFGVFRWRFGLIHNSTNPRCVTDNHPRSSAKARWCDHGLFTQKLYVKKASQRDESCHWCFFDFPDVTGKNCGGQEEFSQRWNNLWRNCLIGIVECH